MIERLAMGASLHRDGHFTQYRDYAAEDWRTDTPERPDSLAESKWKIVLDYGGNNQQYGYFWGGLFRGVNGGNWKKPVRWAYLRLQADLWNGSQFTLPDGSIPQPRAADPKQGVHIDMIAGQQLIDILKRSFTTTQIQDMMDASPYDEPDTGAPETPGAMG